jgi:hypothetical protein
MLQDYELEKYGIYSINIIAERTLKPDLVIKFLNDEEHVYKINKIDDIDSILVDILIKKNIKERLIKINKIKEKIWKQNYQKMNY